MSIPFMTVGVAIIMFFTGLKIGFDGDFIYLFLGMIAMPVVFLSPLLMFINSKYKKHLKEIDEKNVAQKKAYQKEITRVNEENQIIREKYNRLYSEWEADRNEGLTLLNKHLNETLALRSQYYTADLIYEKYRNLPALTSICEYFITGRCDQLTGPTAHTTCTRMKCARIPSFLS